MQCPESSKIYGCFHPRAPPTQLAFSEALNLLHLFEDPESTVVKSSDYNQTKPATIPAQQELCGLGQVSQPL
jgi:hypothetical protein